MVTYSLVTRALGLGSLKYHSPEWGPNRQLRRIQKETQVKHHNKENGLIHSGPIFCKICFSRAISNQLNNVIYDAATRTSFFNTSIIPWPWSRSAIMFFLIKE